jgi:hypothetical protein
MTAVCVVNAEVHDLRALVDRAASILANARSSAEILDARDVAGFAYDVAKRAARFSRAKVAHDVLIAAAHRAQADALEIEAAAKRRLADEYDAAQARGEVAAGRPKSLEDGKSFQATASDLGLRHDQIHDARLIRDAEAADPGIVRRTLDEKLQRGEEPTRSAVRRAAEDRLQRSLDRLRRTQESVRQLEETKAPPLTPEHRALQVAVFGTPEDRAIHERLVEIVELVGEQPTPAEAVRRIPPASRHAVETAPIRHAAAWLTSFSSLYEQEVQNGTDASE